ncbi:hypothetical protein AAZX31_04G065200 [Glycine max]|uniref:C2 NT-type domain-containing protein n=3 Tax=Glycine subgen. Soja TaxID=1462606 RepID=A0A0R0KCY3_SOYBN|nr:uncharacterized protein LOC100781723 isoform X2 [Glycine max]XP_028227996.1 uncharacterized protein LOC114408959 isoform X2 [Glycine soja]KAH1110134.1 hypothetical protein GYH30_009156 [Glycine max]KAH1252822.1 hypothetical protein GmHk_04G009685 [Glycine max]KRH61764.1 hypothetical protein GLYMA_04G066600v4 [Glycine max]RZC15361.1 hypothetical protein D0Y65_008973 [Glycine soja]|eukprot:XP_003523688.2 uncharacterized protein LOC100781723 isoform X2 [Glycine max]
MPPMKCWVTRLSGKPNKQQHAVKLTQLKLELGLFGARLGAANDRIAFEITGIATKKETTPLPLVPFSKRRYTHSHTTCSRRFLSSKSPSLAWEARDLCGFHLLLKDHSLDVCDIAFHVLYGEGNAGESKAKMTAVGKAEMSVAVAELVVRKEKKTQFTSHHDFQRRLPIKLKVNGLCIEATLLVSMRLLKLRDSNGDSAGPFGKNWVQSEKKRGIIKEVKYLASLGKKNKGKFDESEQTSPHDSDRSPVFDSDDSYDSTTSSGSSSNSGGIPNARSTLSNGSESFTTSETAKTRLSHLPRNRSLNTQTSYPAPFTKSDKLSPQLLYQKGNSRSWEYKDFSSRDGQTKLKTNVFFASFDQMSERASGESACTVLVALIAHWLHTNHGMPTRAQFERLITQGSSEWRRLCNSDDYSKLFPDKHFDLETVIEANLRPLVVLPQKSYTGFFSPEKFQCLKGAMSFDEIWNEIKSKVGDKESRVYIVSWNDHFFVLKVEADAYYIIDSLGERLYEGCQQAFILKFDDSSVMYGKIDKAKEVPISGASREKICRGKECCKEFIKRFLAAIPLWQLEKEEKEEKKWSVSSPYLHRQLQIDFHYSSSSSSSASADSLWSLLESGSLEA